MAFRAKHAALAALLLFSCGPKEAPSPRLVATGDEARCAENLRDIYQGLVAAAKARGGPPTESGVAFFASLIAEGTWPADPLHVAKLSCPGSKQPLAGADLPPQTRFQDLSAVDERWSAYAGRDQARAPLARLPGPGSEVLLACDNALGSNHPGRSHALFADGSVVTYEVELEIQLGHLTEGATHVPIGPDSPIPALRALRADPRP